MKNIHVTKIIKLAILISLLVLILFNPLTLVSYLKMFFVYAFKFTKKNGSLSIVVVIVSIVIIWQIIKLLFQKYYVRSELEHINMKKNTYSKGNAKFQTLEEMKKSTVEVNYDKHNTDGYIVGQYKKYNVKLGVINRNYYFPQYLSNEKVLRGNEELSNAEQIKVLKENKEGTSIKEKIVGKISNSTQNIAFIDNNPIHELIIATTRAGKTQTLVLPQIDYLSSISEYKDKPHMVMSDPKGEIFQNTAKDLEERGYEVLVLNLKDFDLSNSYNPLETIKLKHNEELEENNFSYTNVYTKMKEILLSACEDIEALDFDDDSKNGIDYTELKDILKIKEKLIAGLESNKDNAFSEEIHKLFNKGNSKLVIIYEQAFINELDENSFVKSETEILKFCSSLIAETEQPIWGNGARSILASYIKYVWEQSFMHNSLEDTFNMYAVSIELRRGSEEIGGKTYYELELEKRSNSHFSRLQHPASFTNDTFKGQMESLKTSIMVFQNLSVGKLVSKHQFDFHEIVSGKKPYAIYLITPDYDTTYNFIVSTFISQLYLIAVEDAEKYYGGKLPRKLHFILDEFANIPKIDQLTSKMTVCLGRGIQFILVVQNKQQLVGVYGEDDTTTILDNTHIKMYLLAADVDTRDWFSKQLGSTTIVNSSFSGKEIDEMSISTSEEEKPLVNSYELNKNPLGQVYGSVVKQDPIKNSLRPAFMYIQKNPTTEREFFNTHYNLHNEIRLPKEIILN